MRQHTTGSWQERDEIPRMPVYLGAAALALLLVGGAVLTWLVQAAPSAPAPAPVRASVGASRREVPGGPPQALFDTSPSGSTGPLTRRARAPSTYRWVDRDRGIVAIPIDTAIDLIAGGADAR